MLNKKGVSGVITAVLLILLVIGAIGVLWIVVTNFINTNTEDIGGTTSCFTTQLNIESASWAAGTLTFKIKRTGTNSDPLSGVSLIVDGTKNTAFTPTNVFPLLGETKTYTLSIATKPQKIEVAPIIAGKTCPNSDSATVV